MSPDPPREDSGDDDNNRLGLFNGDVIEGMMDDQEFFLVPDAPYELDMEDESDYTDTDDEGGSGATQHTVTVRETAQNPVEGMLVTGSQEPNVVEGQGRGRYRLLIPFPTATPDTDVSSNGTEVDIEGGRTGAEDQTGQSATLDASETHGSNHSSNSNQASSAEDTSSLSTDLTNQPSTSGTKCHEPKREIELTDEKVETIMQVMKNITLPPAAIPNWATELDEDLWKKKLHDSISTKTSKNNNVASKPISKEEKR